MPDDPDARAYMRRRHPAWEPTDPPPLPRPPALPATRPTETPSFMARTASTPLARLLVMIAAACTGIAGVVTATGAAVSSVIATVAEANARRSNVEIDRRLDAVETRVNGGFGLPLEVETRQKKDEELVGELVAIKARLSKCEAGDFGEAFRHPGRRVPR